MAKVKDTPENFKICMNGNCSTCPSYPQDSSEGLFCARGKSSAKITYKGCDCPECQIWLDNDMTGMYYCSKKPAD